MIGEAIPDAETFEYEIQSIQSKMALVIYQAQQTYLCSTVGDHERGAKMALKRGDTLFRFTAGCPPAMQDALHRGFSLFEMARRTRKKKGTRDLTIQMSSTQQQYSKLNSLLSADIK